MTTKKGLAESAGGITGLLVVAKDRECGRFG
jgi:hypothetical protein